MPRQQTQPDLSLGKVAEIGSWGVKSLSAVVTLTAAAVVAYTNITHKITEIDARQQAADVRNAAEISALNLRLERQEQTLKKVAGFEAKLDALLVIMSEDRGKSPRPR